jgi:predicted O-methyltransferase YrrM
LEIGLAYGISALCIAESIRHQPGARHIVIDPFQNSESWQGVGLLNLQRAGLDSVIDFREEPAQMALPKLISEGVQIDFAYIDAGKRMDDILIFVHFLGRLLRVGGLIAFDDLTFPGIRKALRYVVQQDHFKTTAEFGSQRPSMLRRSISYFALRMPKGDRLFAPELLRPDEAFGVSGNCVVLDKIAEPAEGWQWHTLF